MEGRLNRREEYKPEYYTVEFDQSHPQLLGVEWSMDFKSDGYTLSPMVYDAIIPYSYANGQPLQLEIQKEFRYALVDGTETHTGLR